MSVLTRFRGTLKERHYIYSLKRFFLNKALNYMREIVMICQMSKVFLEEVLCCVFYENIKIDYD